MDPSDLGPGGGLRAVLQPSYLYFVVLSANMPLVAQTVRTATELAQLVLSFSDRYLLQAVASSSSHSVVPLARRVVRLGWTWTCRQPTLSTATWSRAPGTSAGTPSLRPRRTPPVAWKPERNESNGEAVSLRLLLLVSRLFHNE